MVPNRPEDKSKGPLDSFLSCETVTDRDGLVKTFAEIVKENPDPLLGQCNQRVFETLFQIPHPFRIEEERDKAFEIFTNTLYLADLNAKVGDFFVRVGSGQPLRYCSPSLAQHL